MAEPKIDPNPLGPDDVASFNAGIVTSQGQPRGTCVKLRRLDGRDHLLHLRPEQGGRLAKALQEYIEHGKHQGLMLELYKHPGLVEKLPATHLYNTLVSMQPKMSHEEAGHRQESTDVVESTFSARGSFVTYHVKFKSGEEAEYRLHECVAFNLWGFISKMVADAETLCYGASGNA